MSLIEEFEYKLLLLYMWMKAETSLSLILLFFSHMVFTLVRV